MKPKEELDSEAQHQRTTRGLGITDERVPEEDSGMRAHLRVSKDGINWTDHYDVGTRQMYGKRRKTGEEPQFLEDFVEDFLYVEPIDWGPGYFREENG